MATFLVNYHRPSLDKNCLIPIPNIPRIKNHIPHSDKYPYILYMGTTLITGIDPAETCYSADDPG